MKFKSIFCFCLALLPSIIHGEFRKETIELLDRIATSGGNISSVFQPSVNGFLGSGMSGVVYKGVLIKTNATVAMKFIPDADEVVADAEFASYRTLGAYGNRSRNIEAYGVPKLHYYGKWNGSTLLGISLLDSEFAKRRVRARLTVGDFLILFRELVRISKYIHSRGICHGDLHTDNIMFRNNQGFVIDYEGSTNKKDDPEEFVLDAQRDWRKFLSDISPLFGIRINWASSRNPINLYKNIQPEGLKRVFLEFIKTAYVDRELNYDKVYRIINQEIAKYFGRRPALVSWLTPDQQREAIAVQIPPIESILFQ
ncbi:uncharacterized protein LOC116337179 [Contarinia nasturtii]|uniref:uncharacterized protein LOC116337179 n=1 Tax=Contarinia nasturtii TaxID=265458 RepID=UPI0012D447B3|nr:uncharacterized protein LOC116337179 [Contarinia nasturtii]